MKVKAARKADGHVWYAVMSLSPTCRWTWPGSHGTWAHPDVLKWCRANIPAEMLGYHRFSHPDERVARFNRRGAKVIREDALPLIAPLIKRRENTAASRGYLSHAARVAQQFSPDVFAPIPVAA